MNATLEKIYDQVMQDMFDEGVHDPQMIDIYDFLVEREESLAADYLADAWDAFEDYKVLVALRMEIARITAIMNANIQE